MWNIREWKCVKAALRGGYGLRCARTCIHVSMLWPMVLVGTFLTLYPLNVCLFPRCCNRRWQSSQRERGVPVWERDMLYILLTLLVSFRSTSIAAPSSFQLNAVRSCLFLRSTGTEILGHFGGLSLFPEYGFLFAGNSCYSSYGSCSVLSLFSAWLAASLAPSVA